MEAFAKFEYEGWQRVAGKYDSVWASSTRQFIPPLLDAAEVTGSMSVLDVGCGPGYVAGAAAERGALSRGLDFSREMVAIAQKKFPHIEFREGDAQNLPFTMPPSIASWPTSLFSTCPIPSGPAPKRSVSSNPAANSGSPSGRRRKKIRTRK
jgi:SAM-dependent methyltransferase